ncbi:MAG: arginase family protein [Acidobacteriia bacterium]|nr:arginase family protein [Terriglobia bacterium]
MVLLNWHHHGAPTPNRLRDAMPRLRALVPNAVEVPAPLAADGQVHEGVRNLSAIVAHAKALAEILSDAAPPIYNLGADCGGELAVVAKLNDHYNGQLRVVWFDAHADLNTPATSPSANFHGMILRTLTGEGPAALVELVPVPISPQQIVLSGLRDADPAEREYIARHRIPVRERFDELDPADPLYVHVDYDVLDGALYPDSVYPTPNGLHLEELISTLSWLRAHHRIAGMSLTEFAPQNADSTTLHRLIREGLGIGGASMAYE